MKEDSVLSRQSEIHDSRNRRSRSLPVIFFSSPQLTFGPPSTRDRAAPARRARATWPLVPRGNAARGACTILCGMQMSRGASAVVKVARDSPAKTEGDPVA